MTGFYPDPNIALAVGGLPLPISGSLIIDDNLIDIYRNKTILYEGSADIVIANTSDQWREGDTLAIINDGMQIAVIDFTSTDPSIGPFVTQDIYPGEAVIYKVAQGVWREIARKATPDEIIIESLPPLETTADIEANPQTKFDEDRTLKGGEYGLTLSFEGLAEAINRAIAVELYIDGTIYQARYSETVDDVRNRKWSTKFGKTVELTEGSHNFTLLVGRDYGGGGNSITVQNVTLKIESIR